MLVRGEYWRRARTAVIEITDIGKSRLITPQNIILYQLPTVGFHVASIFAESFANIEDIYIFFKPKVWANLT